MGEKVDVIIVGAGLAGTACAFVLAKAGVNVVVLERGNYAGAKNVMGGILFTTILERLIPDFLKEAPLERFIKERKFSLLSRDTELAFSFQTEKYNQPPHNHSFTVLRAKFDRWFATKAEELGAMILSNVVVDGLIWQGNKCVGVKTRLRDGDLYADVVVLAEGANSVIAEQEGLKPHANEKNMAVAAKELISLPQEIIEQRFQLLGAQIEKSVPEGVAIEYFGDAVQGMFGNAFIYTNRHSLSVGIGCTLNQLIEKNLNPHDLLEYFKDHPCVRHLLRNGKTVEYCAHMIPEGGYRNLSRLAFDGILLIGDCAGLVNSSFFHEGSNLAMASGVYAGETIIEALRKGNFSRKMLSSYEEKLCSSFVVQDLKKFRHFPSLGEKCPELAGEYPELLGEIVTRYFEIGEKSKWIIEREVIRICRKKLGVLKFGKHMFNLARAMGWI